MRKLLSLLLFLLFLGACSESPHAEELAARAAKEYYDHLIVGDYAHFLNGKLWLDSLPENYREQLLMNYKQFMAQQQTEHHGIREVRIMNAQTDTVRHYTNAFLVLCFGDSTNEEIVVPMVEHEGRWLMR